jgi:hypothetical protein
LVGDVRVIAVHSAGLSCFLGEAGMLVSVSMLGLVIVSLDLSAIPMNRKRPEEYR